MHADWVLVGAITAGGDPERPDVGMYVVPRSEVTVLDTWNTAGMVGTGSNDVAIEDVFVPAHRRLSMTEVGEGATPGARWFDAALYRMPMLPFLALTAGAPAVGAARKAVRLFRERVAQRMLFGTRGKQDARPVTQARLGRVAARMANAETQLMALAAEVAASGAPAEPCPLVERGALPVRIGLVVREIVTEVLEASGAHAQFLDNPLQRIQRDLNTLSGHSIFDLDVGTEVYGRLLLGYPANGPV